MSIQSFVRVGPPRLFLLGLGFALSGAVSVVLGQAPDWNGPRGNVPPIGTTHSFCLLVDFPDCPADPALTPAEVARLLNEQGYTGFGQRGSIRDYWQHASGGKFDLVTDLPFGWYRAARPKSYYGGRYDGRDILVNELFAATDQAGFDFAAYDADGDQCVGGVSIFFAGAQLGKVRPGFGPAWYTGDGVIYFHHTIGALVPMGTPRTLNLEVTYHEMAHALFSWWDLYSSTDSGGVGLYCLMSGGETEPSAYLRVKNGWPSVTEIAGPAEGLVVADDGGVYKYTNSADPREYYLIENRCRRDWNSFLPDEGLAIWHIDESMIGVPQVHRVVTLEQADGRFDLDRKANVGDSTDLYGGADARQFSEVTVPSSRWWSGQSSGLIITNISDPGPVMTFDVRLVGDCDGDGVPDGQEIAAGAADCNANATPDSCEPDRDSDGAVDSCDNCRELANSDQSDGDGDGWGDACDACPGTIPGGAIIEGCPPGVPYDLDIDGDVDEDDLQQFEACAAGPGVLPADWLCGSLDIDLDGDIDQVEFAYLQRCWSGRDVLGDLDCWMP